jgi:diacylglycerol kinase
MAGVRALVVSQPNARIHLAVAILALAVGVALRLSWVELAIVCLTIAMVISVEAVNTAVEALVDLLQPEYHQVAGLAKDLSAGAVLISALGSVAVAGFLYLPKLFG